MTDKHKKGHENVLRESEEPKGLPIQGYDFNQGVDYDKLIDEVKKIKHVVNCAPRIQWFAILGWGGYLSVKRQITIVGIDLSYEENGGELKRYFIDGGKKIFSFTYDSGVKPNSSPVVIGSEIIAESVGGSINLVTVRPVGGSYGYFDRKFEIVGNFKTGMSEYDSGMIFMPLQEAQKFLRLDAENNGRDVVTDIAVTLDDYNEADNVKKSISELLANNIRWQHYYTQTWEETKAILLQAVSIEKNIQIVILFFIVIVAGFNIIAIFTLMVRSKTKDIGILKALGATSGGISMIFMICGILCGTIGSIIGVTAGVCISNWLNGIAELVKNWFGFELFPKDIYYLDAIPVEINLLAIVIIVISTMLVSLLFSIYPAVKAAKYDPVEAIRYE